MRDSISVFFPAYNDEHTIGELVRKTLAFLPKHFEDYEVIAVNDGSSDGTGAILEQLRSWQRPFSNSLVFTPCWSWCLK